MRGAGADERILLPRFSPFPRFHPFHRCRSLSPQNQASPAGPGPEKALSGRGAANLSHAARNASFRRTVRPPARKQALFPMRSQVPSRTLRRYKTSLCFPLPRAREAKALFPPPAEPGRRFPPRQRNRKAPPSARCFTQGAALKMERNTVRETGIRMRKSFPLRYSYSAHPCENAAHSPRPLRRCGEKTFLSAAVIVRIHARMLRILPGYCGAAAKELSSSL